jgi:hypothetical protein
MVLRAYMLGAMRPYLVTRKPDRTPRRARRSIGVANTKGNGRYTLAGYTGHSSRSLGYDLKKPSDAVGFAARSVTGNGEVASMNPPRVGC